MADCFRFKLLAIAFAAVPAFTANGMTAELTASVSSPQPVGTMVTMVGFGATERNGAGMVGVQYELGGRGSISCTQFQLSDTNLLCFSQTDNKGKCRGDSGGPAFVTLASGEVVLAGVTSRGYTDCGKGGFYGIPYAALCWLNEETGVDLRTDACEACDCLDIAPKSDDGCNCASGGGGGPLGLVVVLALAGFSRRRRR